MLVEVNARTYSQMIVMVCIYVVNAVVNAVLFGIFVEQFQIIRKKETEYQDKIDTANKTMNELKIAKQVQTDIRNYFQKINET